jgi:glycosidase
MNYKVILTIIAIHYLLFASAQTNKNSFSQPPVWAKNVIWYQIFVERFYNADKKNDPTPETVNTAFLKEFVPKDWSVTSWTSNWYQKDSWAEKAGMSISTNLQNRKYGGDIQGVIEKLPYLQTLGVTALFLNPINDAPSMHKYDARNYHHIDVNFGPDPIGDQQIIASENPGDPNTWKWTSADRLFLKLVKEVHRRGMKIIIDYSWNHTGTNFWAWQDMISKQDKSAYKDWYDILSFDDPKTPQNEFKYKGWLGINSLPELKKVNITSPRVTGHPYDGNINEGAKAHIFAVTKRWLAPDGDKENGVDGYRLDVADQIGMVFWREFRKQVRATKSNAYLIGEIWWEQWPDKLMNPAPYTQGDVFDAVMYYQTYRPARYFFSKNDFSIDAKTFRDSLVLQWERVPVANRYAMMNVSSSHDAPRLLTDFFNPNKYKYGATPTDNKNYKTGKPDAETFQRLKLYLVHLFTSIGAPQIFNGEEMGMWGADDPFNRKPLMWKEFNFEPETQNYFQIGDRKFDSLAFNQDQYDWYQRLIHIRKSNDVLSSGKLSFLMAEGKKLAYKRSEGEKELFIYFNLENKNAEFRLPTSEKYQDLLSNQIIQKKVFEIAPLSAMILKRIR